MLRRSDRRTKGSVAINVDSLHTELLVMYGSGKMVVGIELGFIEGCSLAAPLGEWLALTDGLLLVVSLGLEDKTFEGSVEGRAE